MDSRYLPIVLQSGALRKELEGYWTLNDSNLEYIIRLVATKAANIANATNAKAAADIKLHFGLDKPLKSK